MNQEVNAVGELASPALGTFRLGNKVFPGLVRDDRVFDVGTLVPGVNTVLDALTVWDDNAGLFESEGVTEAESWRVDDLEVLPPIQPVGSIFAAGANYREHILQITVAHKLGRADADEETLRLEAATETDERSRTGEPYFWAGLPSAVSGAYDDVILPEVGDEVDWELELGVVIGKTAYKVSRHDALDYVAGYTIVNDISARSLVPRKDIPMMGTDWYRSKNHPTFFPTGPYVIPRRYIPDPQDLEIRLALNGDVLQSARTDGMLFDVRSLLSYASSFAILRPGDVLITGSPHGNGSHWGRFLQDGDVMEAGISGLGVQRNKVVGPTGQLAPWHKDRK